MIFLTVGHERSFDRLTQAVDLWCAENPEISVFGQLAQLSDESYIPNNFEWKEFLDPDEFNKKFKSAKLIIAHAGMGSIITALTMAKPILIMARRGHLKETRNDHQVATARHFSRKSSIALAKDEFDFPNILDSVVGDISGHVSEPIGQFAEPALIDAVRSFILQKQTNS